LAKRKAKPDVDDDDDDDDDVPPRVGWPRNPEPHGPPKPERHEREIYFRRLQAIIDAIEIPDLARAERLYLQRMIARYDFLRELNPKRFGQRGDEQVTILLRTVFESTNCAAALTLPILKAVLHGAGLGREGLGLHRSIRPC
jgi:hypothetical protein